MADKKISALTAATTPLAGTEVLPIVQSGVTKQVSVANLTAGRAVSALSYAITGTSYSAPIGTNTIIGQAATTVHQAGNAGFVSLSIEDGGNPCGVFVTNTFDGTFSSQEVEIKTCEGGISAATTRLKATKTGDIQVSTGNLVIGTSGKGIDFSVTPGTGTSELLADYEEGTWTPVPKDAGGDQPTSFFVLEGRYTKIGRIVTATAFMSINVAGSFGEFSTVEGLPFTVANFTNNFSRYGASFSVNTATNVRADGGPYAFENSTVITVGGITGGSTGQQLHMTIVYQAA